MESSSSSSSSSRMAPRGAASSVSVGNVRGTFEELSRTGGRGFNMGNSASMNAAAGAGSSDTFELGDGPAVTADSPALVTARGKDTERLRRQPQKDSSFGGASMDDDDEAHSLSKKRSDKNSREQMRYRKILYLIDNIREKLESVGVLSGKESKTEVISAAGAYINQMKRQCENYTDLRAFSSDFYGGLFQCAPYAMALATQSGRLIEANSIFMHYFNVTVKPISPQESIFNLIHPSELPEFYIKLGHLMRNPQQAKHKFIRIPLMCSGNASDLSSNLVVSVVESSNPEVFLLLSILSPDDLAILSLL